MSAPIIERKLARHRSMKAAIRATAAPNLAFVGKDEMLEELRTRYKFVILIYGAGLAAPVVDGAQEIAVHMTSADICDCGVRAVLEQRLGSMDPFGCSDHGAGGWGMEPL